MKQDPFSRKTKKLSAWYQTGNFPLLIIIEGVGFSGMVELLGRPEIDGKYYYEFRENGTGNISYLSLDDDREFYRYDSWGNGAKCQK